MTSVMYTNGSGHAHVSPSFERSVHPLRRTPIQRKMSLTNFLYADSYVALDRLDDWMRRGLLESHKPIGFLMQEHRLETFREIVGCGREMAAGLGTYFNAA